MTSPLPIDEALPRLITALRDTGQAVLQAPPGAGKTTRVPLAMLDAGLTTGKIVMLEPRRLAARAAAARMAETLGEPVGETVGFRIRGESKVSKATKIEVVTEGILTRMIQSDPTLPDAGAVIFDEFHERSLNADLGLALSLEVRSALRDDLFLLVMSATLDAEPVAKLMGDAPVVTSEGRSFPVDIQWLDAPLPKTKRFTDAVADLVRRAATESEGGILVFLPGEGEIRRVMSALDGKLSGVDILPLYGSLPFKAQQAALKPTKQRKVVLATSIAETSLTIPDIRVVVDGGQARRARFDPGSGMSRLVTETVTRAEAEQRRGRAGRVAEGVCYRLWTRGEDGAHQAFPPAEIEAADLTGLALELAEWGSDGLPFLTPPPDGALSEARALLTSLGALDGGSITDHGRQLAKIPLHPRLAHMLTNGGPGSVLLAAMLSDRDPLRGAGADIDLRLKALNGREQQPTLDRIRAEAKRLARFSGGKDLTQAQALALAYPDRVGLRRPGDEPRWLLSGGKGAKLDAGDPLAGSRLIVVADTDGHPRDATIRLALDISESELRDVHAASITEVQSCAWSSREKRVIATRGEKFGEIALSSRAWKNAPAEAIASAMLEGVRALGLLLSPAAERFRSRVEAASEGGADLPDMSDEALMASLEDWLLPHLAGVKSASDWKTFDALPALRGLLDWDQTQALNRAVPSSFTTPLGRDIPIDYSGDSPEISVRLQEMFGVTTHPTTAGRPLRVTLLSPAQRPLQTTMDLPGFWASSYADVRKDMRGQYPKHPWPEDPTVADPTLRAKRHKT